VGAAMFSFLGIALMATSIALTVATFGAAVPVSALVFAAGGSVVGAGFATIGGIFANRARKGKIARSGEDVKKKQKKYQMLTLISERNNNDRRPSLRGALLAMTGYGHY